MGNAKRSAPRDSETSHPDGRPEGEAQTPTRQYGVDASTENALSRSSASSALSFITSLMIVSTSSSPGKLIRKLSTTASSATAGSVHVVALVPRLCEGLEDACALGAHAEDHPEPVLREALGE